MRILLILLCLPAFRTLSAQSPSDCFAAPGFYDPDSLVRVDIHFTQSNYWQLLLDHYATKTPLPATVTIDGVSYDSVGVRFKGSTSFLGNPYDKKSFNVDLNQWHDQDHRGYQNLNLHGNFEDPAALRELLFNDFGRCYGPALRSNVAWVTLNGEDWGVYTNVQQPDSDFIREWFSNADGTRWRSGVGFTGGPGGASINYLGNDTTGYFNNYTLKKTHKADPWTDLIHTARVLETQPLDGTFFDTLDQVLHVDAAVWFLVHENLFADEDSYIVKGGRDYYLYWDSLTGRATPLEYDGNSTMYPENAYWDLFPQQDNPLFALCYRVFQTPELRQRYLAHLRTALTEFVTPAVWEARIQHYETRLDSLVFADPQAIYDYDAFVNELDSVRWFLEERRNFLLAQPAVDRPLPEGTVVDAPTGTEIAPDQSVAIVLEAQGVVPIQRVRLYHSSGEYGRFQRTDLTSPDGGLTWQGTLPAHPPLTRVRYYLEIIADDDVHTARYLPRRPERYPFRYRTAPNSGTSTVTINELMPRNETTLADEAGEFDDWLELYNHGTETVDLSGWHLSDDPDAPDQWAFPAGTVLEPDAYLIVWADEDSEQGPLHTHFKLSGNGETLLLSDADLALVETVEFPALKEDESYARLPNGTGDFSATAPTPGANNDPPPPPAPLETTVALNELMSDNETTLTDPAGEFDDWLELYNHGDTAVDLTGWYLTDDPVQPAQWQFPVGTILPPDGYLLVWLDEDDAQDGLHADFRLSAAGETVWLRGPDLALADSVVVPALATDLTYARRPNGLGAFETAAPTPLMSNDSSVRTADVRDPGMLELFPNPTHDRLGVRLRSGGTDQALLYDALGRAVRRFPVASTRTEVVLGDLPPGVYTLRLMVREGVWRVVVR